ncbi:MAG TPA: Fic family protein [Candidatus Thermoplasmatota archaeon]|nr:Fic family protein [Candidatus Thermoplasmatota archaeon]
MKYNDTDILIDESLFKKIDEKKHRLDKLRPLPKAAVKKLLEDIRLRHTYHSDAIEGNTLTLQETKLVLEQGITIGGKQLKDHIEARNDADAFDFMLQLVQKKISFSQEIIQQIHDIVTKGLAKDSGKYRTGNVRITGSSITPPSYNKIVPFMDNYIEIIQDLSIHPLKKAAIIHHELLRIHPFFDGNGRVARLVTNLFFMQEGYPPIVLKQEQRKTYYHVLHQGDNGNLSPFAMFLAKAMNEALQFYLSVFIDEEHLIPLKELAEHSPYSQEYLSLRARQGKLDAVKLEEIWYSSNRALKEYIKTIKL